MARLLRFAVATMVVMLVADAALAGVVRPVRRHLGRLPFQVGAPLLFPYQDPTRASALYAFGLNPWASNGEIHGGIDIVAVHRGGQPVMAKYAIVAPATGRVERIVTGTTGAGLASAVVLISMNRYWYVALVFEPQSATAATNAEQLASIAVTEGQAVAAGQVIGHLVVWNVVADHYPHVHLGLLYKNPAQSVDDVFADSLSVVVSNGTGLPPTAGAGSPSVGGDLGIPTTFFCPWHYSTAEAKAVYGALPVYDTSARTCSCPCAYGSQSGDCGSCH